METNWNLDHSTHDHKEKVKQWWYKVRVGNVTWKAHTSVFGVTLLPDKTMQDKVQEMRCKQHYTKPRTRVHICSVKQSVYHRYCNIFIKNVVC